MRREVSAKARGARGARGARWARIARDSITAGITRRTRVSLGANGSFGSWLRIIWNIRADRAALSVWNNGIGAVGCVLTDHLVAHDGSAVADADLAGFWFPYILVIVQLSI